MSAKASHYEAAALHREAATKRSQRATTQANEYTMDALFEGEAPDTAQEHELFAALAFAQGEIEAGDRREAARWHREAARIHDAMQNDY